MIWSRNRQLASAVSNAGGLGLIDSGSMNPDLLEIVQITGLINNIKPVTKINGKIIE
jgi:NAD(P)H-dependent flavin oxidoreductase YrpB (nitropropane dioxygenase family)